MTVYSENEAQIESNKYFVESVQSYNEVLGSLRSYGLSKYVD